MTKEEIRAISLDKLALNQAKRMLDVGSGTGSVTIQAAKDFPHLEVVAIERHREAVALTRANLAHFNCTNVSLHEGLAPIDLAGPFDAIFIGGTGGNMQEILTWCGELMAVGGRLVLNFILLENALEALSLLEKMGIWVDLDVVSIQTSRWTALGKGHYFQPQNPIIILSCQKAKEES